MLSGKLNDPGITPTTVVGFPPSFTTWPTMFGSEWNVSRHSPSDSITTGGPPACPSTSVNVRPNIGL